MKIHKIIFTLLIFSSSMAFCANDLLEDAGDRALYWWNQPSSNDPRVIAVSVVGAVGAALGLYVVTKGINATFYPNEKETFLRRTADRIGGLFGITGGTIIVGIGLAAIISSREVINYVDYVVSKSKLQS